MNIRPTATRIPSTIPIISKRGLIRLLNLQNSFFEKLLHLGHKKAGIFTLRYTLFDFKIILYNTVTVGNNSLQIHVLHEI